MNINGAQLGPVFRQTKVKVIVQEPSKCSKKWSILHKEEGKSHIDNSVTYNFECGKASLHQSSPDEPEYFQKLQCQNTSQNILTCQSDVQNFDWHVDTKLIFTPEGITVIITNRKKKVSMTAFYVRAVDPWAHKKKKLLLFTRGM
jgi:hypothetical protein